jgi:hypothetical protein
VIGDIGPELGPLGAQLLEPVSVRFKDTPTPVLGGSPTEAIRLPKSWRSLEESELAVVERVPGRNNLRLLEPIGYVPPVEREEAYYCHQPIPAELAGVTK